jgi:hypothetical protein
VQATESPAISCGEHVDTLVGRTPFGVLQVIHQQQAQALTFLGTGFQRLSVQRSELRPGRLHGRIGRRVARQLLEALPNRPIHLADGTPVTASQGSGELGMQRLQALRITCVRH